METSPVTCRTLEEFYHIDGHTFEKQYKETLSGFRNWEQLEHADEWILFPENIGPHLAIDESSLSNGELYTLSPTVTGIHMRKALWQLSQAPNRRMSYRCSNK